MCLGPGLTLWYDLSNGKGTRELVRWIFKEVECGGVEWIKLAQDRARWRALVTAVMNLWVP